MAGMYNDYGSFRSAIISANGEIHEDEIISAWEDYNLTMGVDTTAQEDSGSALSSLKDGFRGVRSSLFATAAGATGQYDYVEGLSESERNGNAPSTARQEFQRLYEEKTKDIGDGGFFSNLFDTVVAAGSTAIENPDGAWQEFVAQSPNTVAVLGGAYAGAKMGGLAGSALSPAGTVIGAIGGGILGMFSATMGLESGNLMLDRASDGELTPDEASESLRQGAVKSSVITAVDVGTLGLNRMLAGAPSRAVNNAVEVTLRERGVDVASKEAITEALKNKEVLDAVTMAGMDAAEKAITTAKNAGRTTFGAVSETVAEGTGEYMGSAAAGLEASLADAVLESVMSTPQSAIELMFAKSNAGNAGATTQQVTGQQQLEQAVTVLRSRREALIKEADAASAVAVEQAKAAGEDALGQTIAANEAKRQFDSAIAENDKVESEYRLKLEESMRQQRELANKQGDDSNIEAQRQAMLEMAMAEQQRQFDAETPAQTIDRKARQATQDVKDEISNKASETQAGIAKTAEENRKRFEEAQEKSRREKQQAQNLDTQRQSQNALYGDLETEQARQQQLDDGIAIAERAKPKPATDIVAEPSTPDNPMESMVNLREEGSRRVTDMKRQRIEQDALNADLDSEADRQAKFERTASRQQQFEQNRPEQAPAENKPIKGFTNAEVPKVSKEQQQAKLDEMKREWEAKTKTAPKRIAVDPAKDNIKKAINKYGGIRKDQLTGDGVDANDIKYSSMIRVNGGKTLDEMAEALAQDGYLDTDTDGKPDIRQLRDLIDRQIGGEDVYAKSHYDSDEAVGKAAEDYYSRNEPEEESDYDAADDEMVGQADLDMPANDDFDDIPFGERGEVSDEPAFSRQVTEARRQLRERDDAQDTATEDSRDSDATVDTGSEPDTRSNPKPLSEIMLGDSGSEQSADSAIKQIDDRLDALNSLRQCLVA